MSSLYSFLGSALVLAGTFTAALGYVLQKKGNVERLKSPEPRAAIYRYKWWNIGLLSMIVSAGLVVSSAPLLDQSKAAPLGAATLVFSTILSTVFLGDRFLVLHLLSSLVIITGSVLAASANSDPSKVLTFDGIVGLIDLPCYVYSSLAALGMAGGTFWIWRMTNLPRARWSLRSSLLLSFVAPALGGACNGFVSYAVKATTTIFSDGDYGSLAKWQYWMYSLLACVAVYGQVSLLNIGLRYFSAMRIVPPFQCLTILSNALAGITYFHDMRDSPAQLGLFATGAIICAGGIMILLLQREEDDARAPEEAAKTPASATAAQGSSIEIGMPSSSSSAAEESDVKALLTAQTATSNEVGYGATSGSMTSLEIAESEEEGGDDVKKVTPWYLLEVYPLVKQGLLRIRKSCS